VKTSVDQDTPELKAKDSTDWVLASAAGALEAQVEAVLEEDSLSEVLESWVPEVAEDFRFLLVAQEVVRQR